MDEIQKEENVTGEDLLPGKDFYTFREIIHILEMLVLVFQEI